MSTADVNNALSNIDWLFKQEWNSQNPNTKIGISSYQTIDNIKEKSDRNERKERDLLSILCILSFKESELPRNTNNTKEVPYQLFIL